MSKIIKNLAWIAIVVLASSNLLHAQLPPCYGNAQAGAWVCPGDTVTLSMNINCSTCTYTWGGNPIGSSTGVDAKFIYQPLPYPDAFKTYQANGSVTDPTNTVCSGSGSWWWEVGVWGTTQMSNPVLLNGPYDGDTSKTWIYRREHVLFFTSLWTWDYNRTYNITGGTLVSSVIELMPDFNNVYNDTLWIKWNNSAVRQIGTSGNLTGSYNGWGLQTPGWCNNYTEDIPPETLNDAFPIGPDSVCAGDTVTYYTTPFMGATFTWTATGGTVFSGQGTDLVRVIWNSLPGAIAVSRDIGGSISSNAMNVYPQGFSASLLPDTANFCVGTALSLDAGPGSTYAWSNGDMTRMTTVTDSGSYSVTVTDVFCGATVSMADTVRVNRVILTLPDLGADTTLCGPGSLFLNAGPGFQSYTWMGGTQMGQYYLVGSNTPGGSYYVSTVDTNGCPGSDTIAVNRQPPPMANLGTNAYFCQGDSVLLDAGNPGATYAWSTGASTQTIYASVPGMVYVDVALNGCITTDSVMVNLQAAPAINLGATTTFCAGDSLLLNAGNPGATYAWSNGATTQAYWFSSGGIAAVTVSLNGCSNSDSIALTSIADCVWPGDCDDSGLADNTDVLVLGAVFGQTGPTRPGASLNWVPQQAPDWSTTIPNGPNSKFADTDGNGVVNADDTLAIALNFGLTHNKTNASQGIGPMLRLVAESDSVMAGDTAWFRVVLGDAQTGADSAYGLAFSVAFDTALVAAPGMLNADFASCWLADSPDLLIFSHDMSGLPLAEFAVVRTGGLDTSGFGDVCRLAFVTDSDISGKRALLAKTLQVSLQDVRFVDHNLTKLCIQHENDSTVIFQEELAVVQPLAQARLDVSPVPAESYLNIALSGAFLAEWTVHDVQGRVAAREVGLHAHEMTISTRTLSKGVYFLRVTDADGHQYRRKFLIAR